MDTSDARGAGLTSDVLEVDGTAAESTAERSSIDMLVDASVLFVSLTVGSMNGFRPCCLLMPLDTSTCPLMFLQSVPNKLSCSKNSYD